MNRRKIGKRSSGISIGNITMKVYLIKIKVKKKMKEPPN